MAPAPPVLLAAGLAALGRRAAASMSRSTSYCYEGGELSELDDGCDFGAVYPACTVDSGSTTCTCPMEGESGFVNRECALSSGELVHSYCKELTLYMAADQTTVTKRVCADMHKETFAKMEPYSQRRRRWRPRLRCRDGYFNGGWWWEHTCTPLPQIGEKCGDYRNGECSKFGYDEDAQTCVDLPELVSADRDELDNRDLEMGTSNPKCVPTFQVYGAMRPRCTWYWTTECNGHACVWNTGDGNFYCDYHAEEWF